MAKVANKENVDNLVFTLSFPLVEFSQNISRNSVEKFFGEDSQQGPSLVQAFINSATFVISYECGKRTLAPSDILLHVRRKILVTLSNKRLFKLVQEFKCELVFLVECFLTNNRLHGRCISADSILGILQL